VRIVNGADRFGLGWRAPLAAAILAHRARIDLVEVVAEEWLGKPDRDRRALQSLAREIPLHVHGVSLGLASTVPVAARRLDEFARLVNAVEPEAWSEHLAFVRGGGREIGHLAAPPRCDATTAGAAANLERARRAVGSRPLVENVATLIDPPASDRDEAEWVSDVLDASDCGLLLDLHNLHANATNFGFDPFETLDRVPLARVGAIHIAGGRLAGRLIDDHLHDVPDEVFALLEEVAARTPRPLTVILERDGEYPTMTALLAELDRARAAVRLGRARERSAHVADRAARERFLADAAGEAARAGLAPAERSAAERIDREGLVLAARSFEAKRARARPTKS
jgi:uncharacterized protein (UPF0276 family)